MAFPIEARLPIALSLPQSLLPPPGAGASRSLDVPSSSSARLGGSGYGPPVSADGTTLSRLIDSTLYVPAAEPTPSEAASGWKGSQGGRTEYDAVVLPLANASWRERWERMCTISTSATMAALNVEPAPTDERTRREAEIWRAGGAFTRGEVNLTRSEDTSSVIGYASNWLEIDSPVEGLRFDSELALRQEISYASFLSLNTVILPPPRPENRAFLVDYARTVNGALSSSWHINLAVHLPISLSANTGGSATSADNLAQPGGMSDDTAWEAWNTIRSLCGYSPRLSVCLELASTLPPSSSLSRWAAEPVKYVHLPCSSFISNAKGYPVLSKSMQAFLRALFKFNPCIVLSDTHRDLHQAGGPLAYAQYIRFLHRKLDPATPLEQYASGYLDHLQSPLQPLMDNLEGETYEGFEKDPIKYRQYEEAIYKALADRSAHAIHTIHVVGAGRGPLVTASLKAAERARRQIKVIAVEKNPNAIVVLQERQALEWGNTVELVFSDMRSFRPREKADIIVSELLGSFGDNELSPECLDGVMRHLKPNGISIPCSYSAYLAPVATSKLHSDVSSALPTSAEARPGEQPYVVMFSAHHILSAASASHPRVQECWAFDHPNADILTDDSGLPLTNQHNTRSCHLTFRIPQASTCHGFAGYFEATLYRDVGLSTHPERAPGDMLSWFPIFFPLQEPLFLPANSEIDVQMWRLTDGLKRKVWFEWSAESFLPASSLAFFAASPPPSAESGTFPGRGGPNSTDTLSPRAGQGAWDGRSRTPVQGGADAFASAPSPLLGSDSQRMQGIEETAGFNDQDRPRIKIGMTRLHNPGGRTSWIGL